MRKKFLIFSIVCLLFCTLSYTYSSFKNTIVGNISGNIKDWVFKVSIDNSTKYEDGYKLYLTGTSGSFNININTTGGTKGADYSIELIGDSSIKYYTDSNYTNLIDNNIYKGSINSNTSGSVTIYYKSSSNIDDDIYVKTRGIIKEPSYAMMKNGGSSDSVSTSGTEFWSYDYRPYIRKIEFKNDLNDLPSNCVKNNLCWDISFDTNQENKVYAYLIDNGLKDSTDNKKSLYNLYIVSESIISAPQNSNNIFSFHFSSDLRTSNLEEIIFNNNFDTSNVTSMRGMFKGCCSLTSLNLRNFDTSNVTEMSLLFYSCLSLTNLDLSNFNTSKVTDMSCMFTNCWLLTNLDLSNFNTANVTNMSSMFQGCYGLTSLNVGSFDTSKVTNMANMFYNCGKLINLDLSNFNTSKLVQTYRMFYGCKKLQTELNIVNTGTISYTEMFLNALTDPNAYVILGYTTDTQSIAEAMKNTCTNSSKITLKQI